MQVSGKTEKLEQKQKQKQKKKHKKKMSRRRFTPLHCHHVERCRPIITEKRREFGEAGAGGVASLGPTVAWVL